MNDKTVVHVVDDDAAMRDSMAFLLDVNGFKPRVYDSASAFLAESPIDALSCVVSDIRMPGMNGIELVRKLKSDGSACPVILVTGHGDVALAVTRAANRYNFTFDSFFCGFVFEFEDLAEHHALLQFDGRTVQANRVGQHPQRKFLAYFGFASNTQRYR